MLGVYLSLETTWVKGRLVVFFSFFKKKSLFEHWLFKENDALIN